MNSMSGSRGPTGARNSNSTGFYKEKIPKGYGISQYQNFSPEQMDLHQSLFPHVGPESYLSKIAGGDEEAFRKMEAPAYRQFNEQIGNLSSRFSGMGTGARHSSGFQNTASQYASDFAQDLQSKRHDMRRQALMDLMSSSNMLLGQRPMTRELYEKAPPKEGFNWQGLAGGAVGAAGGFFAGGPMGAVGGAKAGYDIGSSFGGHKGSGGGNSFQSSKDWDFGDWAVNNVTGW
jgi:hypothetical protein